MTLAIPRLGTLLVMLLATLGNPVCAGGRLVIVGGGLEPDNHAVHQAFVGALPESGKVVIVPTASSVPASSGRGFAEDLQRYGVGPERITVFPLAILDDETTPDVDESSWRDNAWDPGLVGALGEPAGFWFTGGDQSRIMAAMTRDGPEASPLLELIRERLAAGAVVGGSSAGAAIMSRHMIAGGDSFHALLGPVIHGYTLADEVEEGRLLLTSGAGFLPVGLVDQHFGRRARLGRLVRALAETGESFGYGIAEDTALVVDLDAGEATVAGSGVVTLVDASNTGFDFASNDLAQGLAIGIAAAGARFPLGRCELSGDIGTPTRGQESSNHPVENGGGMAFPHESLVDLLGPGLVDNATADSLQRFSMGKDGSLLIYAFSETDRSAGFRKDDDGRTRYSVCNVRFDVRRAEWEIVRAGAADQGSAPNQNRSLHRTGRR